MKICVIGDSHVGSLKFAYDAMQPKSPHELVFFAAAAQGIDRLEATDGRLTPPAHIPRISNSMQETSGGLREINPEMYDVFLLIGMVGSVGQMVWTIARPLSEAVRVCAITDFWQTSRLPPLLKAIRHVTQKPVYAGLTPLLAREQANDMGPERYSRFVDRSNALFFSDFDVQAIGQPPQTIVNGHATKIEYARMASRLLQDFDGQDMVHPDTDNSHMNKTYGALWLAQFFAAIEVNSQR